MKTYFAGTGGYSTSGGLWALVTGDFNSDGKVDVAAAGDSMISIFKGTGSGFSPQKVNIPSNITNNSANANNIGFLAYDFNKDGKLDLMATNLSGNSVFIMLGDGQ